MYLEKAPDGWEMMTLVYVLYECIVLLKPDTRSYSHLLIHKKVTPFKVKYSSLNAK